MDDRRHLRALPPSEPCPLPSAVLQADPWAMLTALVNLLAVTDPATAQRAALELRARARAFPRIGAYSQPAAAAADYLDFIVTHRIPELPP
jgi:hypothetical protein